VPEIEFAGNGFGLFERYPDYLEQLRASGVYRFKTPEQGAATSVLVATSPQLEGIGGRYFQDCNEAPVVDLTSVGFRDDGSPDIGSGVASYALDPGNAERLWELSQATLS
jgi:hypothetical protein